MLCLNLMLTISVAGLDLMSLVYWTNINNNCLINNYVKENLPFSCASGRDVSQ